MFSAVLRHLRRHKPEWTNYVVAADGRQTALDTLAITAATDLGGIQFRSQSQPQTRPGLLSAEAQVVADKCDPTPDVVYEHVWPECPVTYADAPSTKTVWCLREVFDLPVDPELLQYFIAISPQKRELVDRYVNTLPPKLAVIHYQGHTNSQAKSLSPGEVKEACDFLVVRGITPVILDWTLKNVLSDGKRIFHPGRDHDLWGAAGTGCAQVIAALMERAAVTICIDSGPGKVALATQTTPALQVWRHMHPIHYCDYAPHAVHLVPRTHLYCMRGNDKSIGLQFFNENYRYAVYDDNQLGRAIGEFAWKMANHIPLETKTDDDSIKVLGPKRTVYGRSGLMNLVKAKKLGFVVGIPTLNRTDLLGKCVASIYKSTMIPKEVIVIDNGQKVHEGNADYRKWMLDYDDAQGGITSIRPRQNLGVAASWNLLHKLAAPLPLIILNDDVEVAPHTFARMLAADQPFVSAAGWSAFLQSESLWQEIGEYDEGFHCLDPETPVLTSDLRWVPIRVLSEGDGLVGVDEESSGRYSRLYRKSLVVSIKTSTAPRLKIVLSDGRSVICTPNHRWLTKNPPNSGIRWKWRMASKLYAGQRMYAPLYTWPEATSFEAGWLSGLYDGEGHLCQSHICAVLGLTQKEGKVLERAISILCNMGIPMLKYKKAADNRQDEVTSVVSICKRAYIFHVLGHLRPSRLFDKFVWDGMPCKSKYDTKVSIVSITDIGCGDVVDIQTTTGTYLANGLISHNSYHEDGDYLWRMKLKGITPFEIDAGVTHEPSQTRKAFSVAEEQEFLARWQEGHQRFQQKWGNLPGREIFTVAFNGKQP